jgi:PadR family transcriptional regulator PadR
MKSSTPRMTLQTQIVLRALLQDPLAKRYGLELCEATALPSGTIYPIVARLKELGWLTSEWEDADRHIAEGRPRRRYYQLTANGAEMARHALASRGASAKTQAVWLAPRLTEGT